MLVHIRSADTISRKKEGSVSNNFISTRSMKRYLPGRSRNVIGDNDYTCKSYDSYRRRLSAIDKPAYRVLRDCVMVSSRSTPKPCSARSTIATNDFPDI